MRTAAVILVVLVSVSTTALGQAPGMVVPPDQSQAAPGLAPLAPAPPTTVTHSYRSQVMLADLAWIGLTAAASPRLGGDAGRAGAIAYFSLAPAVHLAHGNTTGALQSVGLRLVLPGLGLLVGAALGSHGTSCNSRHGDTCDGGFAIASGAFVGGAVGMATAMVVDWTLLAKKTDRRIEARAWAPAVAVTPTGLSVGATGRF